MNNIKIERNGDTCTIVKYFIYDDFSCTKIFHMQNEKFNQIYGPAIVYIGSDGTNVAVYMQNNKLYRSNDKPIYVRVSNKVMVSFMNGKSYWFNQRDDIQTYEFLEVVTSTNINRIAEKLKIDLIRGGDMSVEHDIESLINDAYICLI